MAASGETPDRPDDETAALVRAALERVLASDVFRGAPQLTAFLRFIVARTLAGGAAELKGYTIAVEAFGRPAQFDPQSDPIVRVEAGRLRKALTQYYAGEGAGEAVRIAIPVGGYVPTFAFEAAGPARQQDAPTSPAVHPKPSPASMARAVPETGRRLRGRVRHAAAALAILILAILVLAATTDLIGHRREKDGATGGLEPALPAAGQASTTGAMLRPPDGSSPGATRQAHLPVLAVTIDAPPGEPELTEIMERFSRILIDTMARFDDLIAIKAPPAGTDGVDGADYVFEMSASRVGGSIEGFARLRAAGDGRIIWTSSATRTLPAGADEPEQVERARRLAIRMAEPFGIIHADFRQFATSPAMRCIFQALDFRRTMLEADHLAARTCLEAVLARDQGFHPAWSQLALLILDEHQLGFNVQPGPPLDRALAAAVTALRLAPSSARAQQVMMDVLFARGALEDAIKVGREALARNPYDPDIMADLGSRFVRLNRPAEGLPLLARAVELSAGRPAWYDFYAFLGASLLGADKLSESFSVAFLADRSALSLLGRALVAARVNDQIETVASLRLMMEAAPLFAIDPRLYLSRKGFAPELADRVIADLGPDALNAARPQ